MNHLAVVAIMIDMDRRRLRDRHAIIQIINLQDDETETMTDRITIILVAVNVLGVLHAVWRDRQALAALEAVPEPVTNTRRRSVVTGPEGHALEEQSSGLQGGACKVCLSLP